MLGGKARVVVTGLGVISPVGNDLSSFWNALLEGKSGAAPIKAFDTTGISTTFGAEIKNVVMEVTDNKKLKKRKRKELQMKRAHVLSTRAKLVKLADKICNLRDVARNPPPRWSLKRCVEYFDWAKTVVDGMRGAHPRLEAVFDETYKLRPAMRRWTRHSKPAVRKPRQTLR